MAADSARMGLHPGVAFLGPSLPVALDQVEPGVHGGAAGGGRGRGLVPADVAGDGRGRRAGRKRTVRRGDAYGSSSCSGGQGCEGGGCDGGV